MILDDLLRGNEAGFLVRAENEVKIAVRNIALCFQFEKHFFGFGAGLFFLFQKVPFYSNLPRLLCGEHFFSNRFRLLPEHNFLDLVLVGLDLIQLIKFFCQVSA